MSDNILTAVLTFSLLAGGTAAIGSEMFNTRQAAKAPTAVVTMPPVTIVARRQVACDVVMLPEVTITGRRDAATQVAVGTQASEPRRVQ
ncbi:MAG: hypothetical protein ACXWCV_08885 [Caldimonas sp.]